MNTWAKSKYNDLANFICICCEGPQLARTMGDRMELDKCFNTVISSKSEGPYWGQLGCSGFIILGKNLNKIISKKTMGYLDVGEKAFRHVESLLSSTNNKISNLNHTQLSSNICVGNS